MRKRLFTPNDDIPTPLASRKQSPVNRLNNAPKKKYITASSIEKMVNLNPPKPASSVNGHGNKSFSESDDDHVQFYPYKNERKSKSNNSNIGSKRYNIRSPDKSNSSIASKRYNTCSPDKKLQKLNPEKPGPSVNGHGKYSSSESVDSDGDSDFLKEKSVNKSHRYNTRSPTKKTANTESEKPGTSADRQQSKSSNDDSDVEFLPMQNDNKSDLNIYDSDFETDGSTSKSTITNRMPYSKAEDEMIIKYVLTGKQLGRCKGNALWKELEGTKSKNINQRSYQSLRNRFLRNIQPLLLSRFRYLLDEDQIKMILRTCPDLKSKNHQYGSINFQKKGNNQDSVEPPKVLEKDVDSDCDSVVEIGQVVYNPPEDSHVVKIIESTKEKNARASKVSKRVENTEKESGRTEKTQEVPGRVEKASKESRRVEKTLVISEWPEEALKTCTRVEETQEVSEVEETDDESDFIKDTPEEDILARQQTQIPIVKRSPEKYSKGKMSPKKSSREENRSPEKSSREENRSPVKSSREDLSPKKSSREENRSPVKSSREENRSPVKSSREENRSPVKSSREENRSPVKSSREDLSLKKSSMEEKRSPEKSSKEDENEPQNFPGDEETQLCLESIYEMYRLSSPTKETEDSSVVVDTDSEKNIQHEESQSLCLPANRPTKKLETSRTDGNVKAVRGGKELIGTPLYRCSMKTKMAVNVTFNKLDRIVNKRKRKRRKRGIPIMQEPQVAIEEEEVDTEEGSEISIGEIVPSLLKCCQVLLTDSDSDTDRNKVHTYIENLQQYYPIKSERSSDSPEKNPNPQLTRPAEAMDTSSDVDSDSDSSKSSTSSTKSPKSPKSETSISLKNFNEKSGLLGNMLKMFQK